MTQMVTNYTLMKGANSTNIDTLFSKVLRSEDLPGKLILNKF